MFESEFFEAAGRRSVPQGTPKGRRLWGRLFFGYFLLAKQKKVTSCRATPGHTAEHGAPKTSTNLSPSIPFDTSGRTVIKVNADDDQTTSAHPTLRHAFSPELVEGSGRT